MRNFLFLLVFLSLESFAYLPPKYTLVRGCALYTHNGDPFKVFPGMYCAFLPDGRLLSADKNLTMLDAQNQVLWTKPWIVHHQINFSHDGKRILTMTSEVKDNLRYDKFVVLDPDGKVLHEVVAMEVLKDKLKPINKPLNDWEKHNFGGTHESSHFNSIHEIPANKSKVPFMKEGNIIVNSPMMGTCVLSSDLKTALDCRQLPDSRDVTTHDVQVTPEGKYIYFNNLVKDDSQPPYSTVDEYDPKTNKRKIVFSANPRPVFFSQIRSGVQMVENLLIISHVSTGAYIIDRKSGKLTGTLPNWERTSYQEIEAFDLQSFLTARKLK